MDSKWFVWPIGNDQKDKTFVAPVRMHLKPL